MKKEELWRPANGDAFGYGIGGWNIPRVKYWLDAELPNMDRQE